MKSKATKSVRSWPMLTSEKASLSNRPAYFWAFLWRLDNGFFSLLLVKYLIFFSVYRPEYKMELYLRITELFLAANNIGEAEKNVKRASLLQQDVKDDVMLLKYKV